MILITIGDDVRITGHADYAPRGQDIVCAAVTAIAQTLICSVTELTGDKITYSDMQPDEVVIHIENPSKEARLLTGSFLVGVKLIADEFPDHVRVKINKCNGLGQWNELGQERVLK